MNTACYSTILLSVLAPLTAQDPCSRPTTQLNLGSTITFSFAEGFATAAPKQDLPGDSINGLLPTAGLVYAVWQDIDMLTGEDTIQFLRSEDGGFSWNPASQTTLWTSQGGEGGIDGDLEIHAENHTVFILYSTARNPDGTSAGGADSTWVLASNDQGQTFQSLNLSPGIQNGLPSGEILGDVDNPEGALSGGRLHVLYETDFTVDSMGGASGNESMVYHAAEFDGTGTLVAAFPNERIVTTFPTGSFDVDVPSIGADNGVVTLAWHDEERIETMFGVNDGDDVVSRTSFDDGQLFGAVTYHTNRMADESEDDIQTTVVGTTITIAQLDSRDPSTSADFVYLSISQDLGFTFTDGILVNGSTADVDGPMHMVSTPASTVLAYIDTRNGFNQVTTAVGTTADFLGGTHVESDPFVFDRGVEDGDSIAIDAFGDAVVVTSEFTPSGGEGAQLGYSLDAGFTWNTCTVADGATFDVDFTRVALSANFDVTVMYAADPTGAENDLFVTGLKLGALVDRTSTGGGVVYRGFPADAGDAVFFAFSLTPPVANALPIPGLPGAALHFVPDGLTTEVGLLPGAFQTIGADGTAVYPLANTLGNFATLFGPFYYIAIPGDAVGVFRSYSDPLEQN